VKIKTTVTTAGLGILCLFFALFAANNEIPGRPPVRGPFRPDWNSLKHFEVPAWYLDGKFGIFIHWGVYSVPAFGSEWYPRQMYLQGSSEFQHHVATYGPQRKFGYKDFIPLFKAEKYDPGAWAALFKKAGAKFVVPVAEHHDGFPMYDSALTRWCAGKMGPKRDLIGDLATAVRGAGLVLGLSSHRAEHWWFMNGGKTFDSDVRDPKYAAFYGPAALDGTQPDAAYLDDWYARCVELVDKYQPQLFWFDWWIEQPVFQPYLQKFAAYYYNQGARWGKGVAINYKNRSFPDEAAVLDLERGQLSDIRTLFWQTDTAISKNSWGYVERQDYKTAGAIVGDLVDIVSKNGALLLNIGPRSDGTIPEKEQEILLEIGQWLDVNGEAIYGTRPWRVYGEGPTRVKEGMFTDTERSDFTGRDIRFTTKGDVLYAIILAWPGEEAVVRSLSPDLRLYAGDVENVELLGSCEKLAWTRDRDGLKVKMPVQKPCDHAFALKITKKAAGEKK
jgi:alpha-L-fucosidase